MSSQSKYIRLRQLLLLTVLCLAFMFTGQADNVLSPPDIVPPPAGNTNAPPAAPATNSVPASAAAPDTAQTDDSSASDNTVLPPVKPIVVHSDRDYDISRMVARLIEENHYLQTPITPEISQRWLKNYLKTLDPTHLFFLQSDIDEFTAKYGNNLGNLVHGDDAEAAIAPAFDIFNRYMERLYGNISLAEKLLHEKFDFTKNETFTIHTDKSPWIANEADDEAVWRGQVKSDLLNGLLDKQSPDKTVARLTKRYRALLRDREEKEEMDIVGYYLDSLARAYDPHSDYFEPDEAENFNIQSINLSVTGIGAVLRTDDDGYASIEQIIPGGPADLDKRLQPGDRIIGVGQGNAEPVDSADLELNKVVDMIRGRKGTTVHLVVLPAGASDSSVHKDIFLKRDLVSIKESHAKADIIEHKLPGGSAEKIGLITLPGFYKETTSDVAKLIQRLKKEGVVGIILDLRNNGGGLLDQAVDLTGLFVRHEPVVQIRRFDNYIDQLGPEDTSQIYNGPLIVMVNKASASATEIVAGALQDYGRAIIVGDQSTHGKGTVQTIVELKDNAPLGFVGDPGSVKITIQKFYRVAGGSTQQKGVVPDIILPSEFDALELGETTLPYYLPYDTVPRADFDYLNLTADDLPTLRANSAARVNASPDFGYVRQDIAYFKKKIDDPTVSLNLATREKEQTDIKTQYAARKKDLAARASTRDKMLEITLDMVDKNLPAAPPSTKKPKIAASDDADSDGSPDIDDAIDNPTDDPQLDETVNVMTDYTNLLRNAGSKLVQATPAKNSS
ncbi:MAG TPA: carboxy terminal-processing peptidase [Candidatus Methylacidiphilales bacterium]|nr:carboxy terminal-processing peptidase [Candidatus Methylacidiphilales bacterium]